MGLSSRASSYKLFIYQFEHLYTDSKTLYILLIGVKICSGNSWKSTADVLDSLKTVRLPYIAY